MFLSTAIQLLKRKKHAHVYDIFSIFLYTVRVKNIKKAKPFAPFRRLLLMNAGHKSAPLAEQS